MAETNNRKNIITVPSQLSQEIKSLGVTFFEKMLEHKNKIAHTDARTGRYETYASTLQKSIRTALGMRTRGIKPNDIITICSNTTMDSFIPLYATTFIGAISANIDPKLQLSDTVHLLKLVSPKMIFVIPEAVKLIEDAIQETKIKTQIVVFGETAQYIPFSDFLLPNPEEDKFSPHVVSDLQETAIIVFSSGSTGLPKGACLTHMGLCGLYHDFPMLPLLNQPVTLSYANLYWISGIVLTPCSVVYGVNRVTSTEFDPVEIWDIIKKYKVGGMFLNSYHTTEMCKNGRPKDADTSSLRCLVYGGAPLTKEQIIHCKSCLPETTCLFSYGQTEASGGTTGFNPFDKKDLELFEKHPCSVGRPIPGCSYKIVDPDTEMILGPNQEGELRIKSNYLMNGYYKMDSSNNWDEDGFFKTGDIAYYDEDQCFFIVDRIKELLKYHMWHISPVKLESILHTHPAVHSSLVIGIPHEVDGDHLMAIVVLKESAEGTITEKELQKYVDDQVSDHQKLRSGVKFVKEFPLTVTSKVSRLQTKRIVLEGKI